MRYLILALMTLSPSAHAYLDPASGSALAYVVISVASASFYAIKNFGIKGLNLLAVTLRLRERIETKHSIVFYSEGGQYWSVFQPVLKWLSSQGREVLFLTSDKNDPALSSNFPHVKSKYIGAVNYAGTYLAQLEADFLGMTTPQLDVLTIKKAKKVKHHAHILHAPVDVFTYRKFAFDYFDSVFCTGPHQVKSIRFLEEKRGTSRKYLPEVGCTYYDFLRERLTTVQGQAKDRPVILIAPTWKEYSLLHKYGFNFFEKLLASNRYEVILRPHPQTYVSYPEVIKEIEDKLKGYESFSVDRAASGEASMQRCDMMISDLSGIIWDYVYLFQKPVLLTSHYINLDGFEGTEIPFEAWEMSSIAKVGALLSEQDVADLDQVVGRWLGQKITIDVEEFRRQSLYNWGSAGQVAGETIINIIEGKVTC